MAIVRVTDDDLIYYYNQTLAFQNYVGTKTQFCIDQGIPDQKKFQNMIYRFNPWTSPKNLVNKQKELDLVEMYLNDEDVGKKHFCEIFEIRPERFEFILMHVNSVKRINQLKEQRPDDFFIPEIKPRVVMKKPRTKEYTPPVNEKTKMTFSAVWPEGKEPEPEPEPKDINPAETLEAHRRLKLRDAVERINPPVIEQPKEPKNNEIEIIVNKEIKLVLAPTLSSERLIKLIDCLKEI